MIVIADVAVVVSDAKASAKWWAKNLGFEIHTVGGAGHAVMVAPPGDRFVLHLCQGFAPLEPGDTGIAFVTDDMDATAARMAKGGVNFPVPPTKEKWGTMAKFADPDGNVFWLMEAPHPFVRATLNLRAPTNRARTPKTKARPHLRRASTPG
ncbi:MAG: VOC family protein [Thermoplasmata archaeon]